MSLNSRGQRERARAIPEPPSLGWGAGSPAGMAGWGTLCGGSSCVPRVLSRVPGLHPLDANSTLSLSCDDQTCLQTLPNVSQGAKVPPVKKTLLVLRTSWFLWTLRFRGLAWVTANYKRVLSSPREKKPYQSLLQCNHFALKQNRTKNFTSIVRG